MIRYRLAALVFMLASSAPGTAQTYTWTGDFFGVWNQALNWAPNGIPNSATAVVNFTGNNIGAINISSSVATQTINFSNPTGGYTLTASAGQIIGSMSAINVGAGVTGTQTISLPIISSGSLLFSSAGDLTITNNSATPGTTLVIGPNTVIGSPGAGRVVVDGAGNTEISGSFASGGNNVKGGLHKIGAGTLLLSSAANIYSGGTFVNGGTLQLGAGTAIPVGGDVTAASGATFNIGAFSNGNSTSTSNAIGTLSINGGTFRVPTGNGNYWLNRLVMTGGAVDFAGTSNFWLHFTGAGAGIVINSGANTWIGAGNSRIQNDTPSPLTINLNGGNLDVGTILSNGGANPNFILSGAGTARLLNTGNTANITSNNGGMLFTNDLSSNFGIGAFGTLGTGTFTLSNFSVLVYDGDTATSAKPVTLSQIGYIKVANAGVNLTMDGVIGQSAAGAQLGVVGSNSFANPSTLKLTASNTYTGATIVSHNAILAISTIANGGVNSPIGASSNSATNLYLGSGSTGRGDLLLFGNSANYSSDRGVTLGGLYDASSGGGIGVQNAATTLTLSGQITNSGSLIKTGAGTLTLANLNNYSGGTYVEAGTLKVGADGAIPPGTDVTVNPGATFDIGTQSNTLGTAIGAVAINGGTFRVGQGAGGNYFLD